MDETKQNYELAFHITANLEESDVQKTRQDLEKVVTSQKGTISFSRDPEKMRLAYPIKHQTSSYFGYFNFSVESSDSLAEIRDQVRTNPGVLRFLIQKVTPETQTKEDVIRKIAMNEKRKARAAKGVSDKSAGAKGEAPKVDEKALESKLEEIIDKL